MLDTGTHHFGLAKDRISQERHPIPKPMFCITGMTLQLKGKTSQSTQGRDLFLQFLHKTVTAPTLTKYDSTRCLTNSNSKKHFSPLDFENGS